MHLRVIGLGMRSPHLSVEEDAEGLGGESQGEVNLNQGSYPADPWKAALLPGETLPMCHLPAGSAE